MGDAGKKMQFGPTPLPADEEGLGVPVTQQSEVKIILKGKREGQGLSGHPLHLALKLGTGFLFTGYL